MFPQPPEAFSLLTGLTAPELVTFSGEAQQARSRAPCPFTAPPPRRRRQARANANDTLARATQALQAFRVMQAAARNIAISGPNNLGADPNHPGQALPNVPNGLVLGGLVPDSGLSAPGMANPVTTWTGANTPTQTTNGARRT